MLRRVSRATAVVATTVDENLFRRSDDPRATRTVNRFVVRVAIKLLFRPRVRAIGSMKRGCEASVRDAAVPGTSCVSVSEMYLVCKLVPVARRCVRF